EDGIRDFHVTGVQTCALPIYARICHQRIKNGVSDRLSTVYCLSHHRSGGGQRFNGHGYDDVVTDHYLLAVQADAVCVGGWLGARSEERRVGKEGGSVRVR